MLATREHQQAQADAKAHVAQETGDRLHGERLPLVRRVHGVPALRGAHGWGACSGVSSTASTLAQSATEGGRAAPD